MTHGTSLSPAEAAVWRAAWERQQEAHEPLREERFERMLEYVELIAGPPRRVLDLACGTGSIAERAHARYPAAEVVGVDLDPILLLLARQAFAEDTGIAFVDADLRDPAWREALAGPFDAILSATALHWLEESVLRRVYADAAKLLRPGGVFANADHVAVADGRLAEVAAATHQRHRQASFDAGRESYDQWWERAEADPALAPLAPERARRFEGWDGELSLPAAWHREALRHAGFASADIVWRWGNDALVVGIR